VFLLTNVSASWENVCVCVCACARVFFAAPVCHKVSMPNDILHAASAARVKQWEMDVFHQPDMERSRLFYSYNGAFPLVVSSVIR